MKTKIPSPVLSNSDIVTTENFDNQVTNKVVYFTDQVPTSVPEGLVENGLVIVNTYAGETPTDEQIYPDASPVSKGIVQVGTNINVNNGRISVANGTTSTVGVVKLSDAINSESSIDAATSKAVKTVYDLANTAKNSKYVVYASSKPSTVPSGLVEGGLVIVA